jgi:ABC-type glutathione transport system ATPase component
VLTAADVTVLFPGRRTPAVDRVTLDVAAGQTVGIVGESGSGKTTLARVLVGLQEPTSGTVSVAGRPWNALARSDDLRRRVQMVFQDPTASLNPRLTVVGAIAEVFAVWGRQPARQARDSAFDLLERVGISGWRAERRPAQLSGGQCQRVAIARALACRPDVLVADEPTSSLDVSVQAQILNLIRDLQAEQAFSLVLISHDLSVVGYMSDHCVVMRSGEVVESGPTATTLTEPQHPYTRALIDSLPALSQNTDPSPAWTRVEDRAG